MKCEIGGLSGQASKEYKSEREYKGDENVLASSVRKGGTPVLQDDPRSAYLIVIVVVMNDEILEQSSESLDFRGNCVKSTTFAHPRKADGSARIVRG